MSDDLLPCPFCGKSPNIQILDTDDPKDSTISKFYIIECLNPFCPADVSVDMYRERHEIVVDEQLPFVVKKWNKRA